MACSESSSRSAEASPRPSAETEYLLRYPDEVKFTLESGIGGVGSLIGLDWRRGAFAHGTTARGGGGEGVEEGESEGAVGEGEGLVLGVDVQQLGTKDTHERQLNRSIINESTRLAGRRDLTTENEPVVVVDVGFVEERLKRKGRDVELRFNNALTLLVGQNGGVGPLAYQQSQCTEKDRLAGASLACNGNKAGAKRDVGLADKGVIFDM